MKIVIAPDSFKGSLSASDVASCIEKGIRQEIADCEIVKIPMADGGEGTVDALAETLGGTLVTLSVRGPLDNEVMATYCLAGEIAVIEMAAASGITLIPRESLNPEKTSTYGTGELINDALARGCKKIILGIGGSATNDGGTGMAEALGVRFLDKHGNPVRACGGALDRICTVDASAVAKKIRGVEFLVACDVTNTLCGEQGAAHVFGRQKGADDEMIKRLDANLLHLATLLKEQLGVDVLTLRGGGAAGGLGAGLYAFCGATLKSGFEIISEVVGLADRIHGASLVITGEGRTDYQTAFGKLPSGVAKTAKAAGIPCILISGSVQGDVSLLYDQGISAAFAAVTSVIPLDDAISNAREYLERAARNAIRAVSVRF